ncbi:MAG: hypothetical protein IPO54_07765 [Micavibrio sp.]|nr:hypothetical protein [Micavibrio sp.]
MPDKVPVIIWSHGYGGNRDGAGFISRYVASHGYIIIHLTHAGSDSSLWEGKPGHPWDVLRRSPITRAMTVERFADVPAVLDQLPNWAAENPEPGARMDLNTLGMSGHSFGAMTTQAMAGENFPGDHDAPAGELVSYKGKSVSRRNRLARCRSGNCTARRRRNIFTGRFPADFLHDGHE